MILRDIIERYRREVLPTFAARTQRDCHRMLDFLNRELGDKDADAVQPRDIGRLLDVPTGKIQRNRIVSVLSAIYSKAVGRWFVADRNPCSKVERNPSKPRTRYVTDAEFMLVYERAPERMQIAMLLAYLTSQRQGDIVSMKWSQITEHGIEIQQGKTGKRFRIAVSRDLLNILRRAQRLQPYGEHVISTSFGKGYTPEGFRALWQRVITGCMKDRLLVENFHFHDLRAKSVSDNKDLKAASELAGHQNMAITRGVYDRGVRTVQPLQ